MLELWRMRSTPLLPSLPGSLWPGVVAPDRVLSMDRMELNGVLMLYWIVLNRHLTVYKQKNYSCYTELFEIELFLCIKMDLALNNLQWLICTKPNQISLVSLSSLSYTCLPLLCLSLVTHFSFSLSHLSPCSISHTCLSLLSFPLSISLLFPFPVFLLFLSTCWGPSFRALGSMEYSLIAITPRSTLTWSCSTY